MDLLEEHASVVEKIKTKLRPGVTLLYVSVTGSQAKKMNSPGLSDYDCLCIVRLPRGDYLLQRPIKVEKFEYDDQLEGFFFDILTAYNYVFSHNFKIYEVFAGIPIYKTQLAVDLEEAYYKVYVYEKQLIATSGQLRGYTAKKLIANKVDPNVTTRKLAAESVYLAL